MPTYNFKSIPVVPTAADFVDIILSKTQRQTPTVVHKGYAIQRIRSFYMRKVKYTASQWHDKLFAIVSGFPKVDDIHPFYADLLNVLYDKDHYKLALGQLSVARNLIDKLASGACPCTALWYNCVSVNMPCVTFVICDTCRLCEAPKVRRFIVPLQAAEAGCFGATALPTRSPASTTIASRSYWIW